MSPVGRIAPVLYRNAAVARQWKWILISGFFEPVFYLFSISVGLGKLVGEIEVGGRSYDYATFAAPALLAASAMNGAIFESTMNVFAKLKWNKTYDGMIATPLNAREIALGELTWCQLRGAAYGVAFLLVMLVMGLVESAWAVLAVPGSILIGLAFAGTGLAATTYMRSWQDFEFVPLVQLPLFLFSATFYPLSTYPSGLRWLVQLSPLYHGVALERQLVLGHLAPSALAHVAFLAVMAAVSLRIAIRRFDVLLRV